MKLDKTKPYATVVGHARARYEQGNALFDAEGILIKGSFGVNDHVIATDDVDGAYAFLTHVLRGGPLSKSQLFKIAEDNNQPWAAVTKAADAIGIVKFTYNKAAMWKLPEVLGVL